MDRESSLEQSQEANDFDLNCNQVEAFPKYGEGIAHWAKD